MNIFDFTLLLLSAAFLNVVVFLLFKNYIIKMENPAMKFLGLNIIKDLCWVGFWIFKLENSSASFLSIIGVFVVLSVFLYFKVIRLLNKS